MPNYDFHALLEPLEFQALVCDIVELRENITLETYKEGRDLGIDGLYTDGKKKTIVQAKRYKPGSFNRLFRDLKNIELPKVRKLDPDRYILGISMDLSQDQHEKIRKLFKEYIHRSGDIITPKIMNSLLGTPKYKHIELNYPKLWFQSMNVFLNTLHKTVHRGLYKESELEFKEAIKKMKSFVSTRVYRKALQKWEQNNVIILSGEPGVGKTTMAYVLALGYLQPDNFDGFVWANSIKDVHDMFEEDKKQVFILDDFWGSIFPDGYKRRNQENQLNKLIKLILESKNYKRLILTTREYVLQQGLQKNPLLKETLERYSLVCTMEEYGYDEKARILFSHIYTSKLQYEYVDYLYKRFDEIVYHVNYNPRVIALFLDKEMDCSPKDYFDELCIYLDNPTEFWKDVFLELSDEAKILSMLLLISSTPMLLSDMECCYRKYIRNCTHKTTLKNLSECIAELEKTMIKSYFSEEMEEIMLKFTMPAVQDFLYEFITENSEQYVPLILQCCAFYNQLQFLFEYISSHCSDSVIDLIIQECISHYHDYDISFVDYDGSWNWDMDFDIPYERNELNRFFDLLRCCDPIKHRELFNFLEMKIKNYCLSMGRGDRIAQYNDLHNLPDIIVRCVEKGMSFNGKDIIDTYYKEAFSVYHYLAMEEFNEVFPEEYFKFHQIHYEKIKRNLRDIILNELNWLYEYDMVVEFDLLIDDIPNVLKEFGLRYTKQFGDKIYDLTGSRPHIVKKQKVKYEKDENFVDKEEIELKVVQEDAENWLLGPQETELEDKEIMAFISRSQLNPSLKAELKKVVKTTDPHYLYECMGTRESIELLLAAFSETNIEIPDKESRMMMVLLHHIGQNNPELLKKLIGFCAESLVLFMYQEQPVIRLTEFLSSEVYELYLKNDVEFRNVVFEKLLLKDEQWVRFLHVPLFIFCNALIFSMESQDEDGILEEYYQDLWGDNFNKLKIIAKDGQKYKTTILYADIGPYYFKRFDWEGCMYRMFEELAPFHFNEFYVTPKLKSYLYKLGTGDINSKILNHVSLCKFTFKYTKFGNPKYSSCVIDDELAMIHHLGITEGLDVFPKEIPKSLLRELQKNEEICKREDGTWKIYVYKIKDMEILKELGVYDQIYKFIEKIEQIYSRFLKKDFSLIN
ncbi:ATP-binding protein [Bacillus smithii]|uniref:ATP-binding protein n=1 Tax=Bacillus smithii TaxID=1479 RepID=UPI002E1B44F6|nr:ATP-binding protein [Bacillus smithii]